MNNQIRHIRRLLFETYEGNPWHGRSIIDLLGSVSPEIGLRKPSANTHSIAELIYHMVNWKEFAISRLLPEESNDISYYESNDWRELDHSSILTWEEGLKLLDEKQQQLLRIMDDSDDSILAQPVRERVYNIKLLLYGVVQHDIYHAGQIAFVKNLLS